ncbi:single-stranded DNA-binding protein [Anaerotignum sp.]|nr:single-stranded DNA-binding protein [Anaerotignum sp.]MBQ7759093.1 single-stranded DNA-binding protein [Anaerotignum sp.]
MQIDGLPENNTVLIAGKIVEGCVFSHEVYGEGFYTFQISSERLSDKADILPVTVSERLIDKELLQVGTKVDIIGQLRSYNNYNSKKNRLVLTIFVREIRLMEEEETKNENQICLNGFICKPPIYRKTPFGREISDILVAVNRAYNKSDYIPCIAWGRNARYMANLEVGSNIRVWGRVQSRTYQKKIGEIMEERVAYEVSVSKIELPGRMEQEGTEDRITDKEKA